MITATYLFCPIEIMIPLLFGIKFNRNTPNLESNLYREGQGIRFIDYYAFVILIFQVNISIKYFDWIVLHAKWIGQ